MIFTRITAALSRWTPPAADEAVAEAEQAPVDELSSSRRSASGSRPVATRLLLDEADGQALDITHQVEVRDHAATLKRRAQWLLVMVLHDLVWRRAMPTG
ncbi:hypothetical protein PE067_00275 [Paracoccus sp. DMF-8]|uniref:hypothetical protein n=1 Tax=Paracoccus sp. DMF-8 TaxID=3019445 RepID=UPI0023E79552|nr:hypothetical protein [Paracoccus sp. DMF-8]MDF3604725.1 hypothetical protein [Paracoccus sp. DMF-8]